MSSAAGGTRRLVYDGDALVAEYDAAGNMPHRYIHGNDPGADDPLVWYDNLASGWRRALLTDHQGSVIQVADMYGNPVATNSYDPWGIPAASNAGRFGYTGQTWVPELGLWHYKARFYSPTLGRFLQVDPIGYEDQINLYAYVGNDPANKSDPTGNYGDTYPTRTWDPPADPEPISPETREKIADAVEVAGVAWDVATVFTGIGAGPEGVVVTKGIAAWIRRGGGEAAENRARNVAAGIPESRLGPSGKPKIHVREHPNLRRAAESAQSRTARGQPPMHHPNPKRGDPHFHPTDAKGKKRLDGVHESYPRRGYRPPKERE